MHMSRWSLVPFWRESKHISYKIGKIRKTYKWDSIYICFYNYWHILVGDRTQIYHPEMPDWRVLGCTCRGGHLSHFAGRAKLSGHKIGKIRNKYKWDSIYLFFYNYWHILVGDRTKQYHPEMPGWRVLGCTWRGGHFRWGRQIHVWKLQMYRIC